MSVVVRDLLEQIPSQKSSDSRETGKGGLLSGFDTALNAEIETEDSLSEDLDRDGRDGERALPDPARSLDEAARSDVAPTPQGDVQLDAARSLADSGGSNAGRVLEESVRLDPGRSLDLAARLGSARTVDVIQGATATGRQESDEPSVRIARDSISQHGSVEKMGPATRALEHAVAESSGAGGKGQPIETAALVERSRSEVPGPQQMIATPSSRDSVVGQTLSPQSIATTSDAQASTQNLETPAVHSRPSGEPAVASLINEASRPSAPHGMAQVETPPSENSARGADEGRNASSTDPLAQRMNPAAEQLAQAAQQALDPRTNLETLRDPMSRPSESPEPTRLSSTAPNPGYDTPPEQGSEEPREERDANERNLEPRVLEPRVLTTPPPSDPFEARPDLNVLAAAPVPETAVPESAVATLAAAPTPPVDLAALSSTLGSGPASEQASDLSLPTPAEAIPMHAEWLAARGGGSVRLQLHPPELGAVELTVRVRGSNVQVVISAIEPAAQALVQASAQQLGEQLASRDLRMDHFEVRALPRDAGAETFNEQARGRFERQDSESRPRFSSNRQPGSNISLGQPVMLNPHSASSQHLAATGVDLRV